MIDYRFFFLSDFNFLSDKILFRFTVSLAKVSLGTGVQVLNSLEELLKYLIQEST